mmetsp:Transcript_35565/g.89682  ORF Transcript_35565/g.89682 Transcript_35565/m.89682 type:complete len:484 (+) Transcript_35565:271-1722(+)
MQSRRGKRATTWEVALLVASLGLARGSFLAQAPANRRGVVNVMILVADGCAVKVPTEEAQQARCVDILASNRYRLDAQTENRLERAKCQAFPAFSKRVSSRLSYKTAYIAAFRRIAPLLAEKGWNVKVRSVKGRPIQATRERLAAQDLIICQPSTYRNIHRDTPHTKYIILASHDSAALGATGLLKDRRLLAYLQHTDFSNPEEHNMLKISGRRHAAWVNESGIHIPGKVTQNTLAPDQLSKVITMIPQIQRWRYPLDCGGGRGAFSRFAKSGFREPRDHGFARELAGRSIDIAFAGQITGIARQEIGVNDHRRAATKAIRALGRKYNLNVAVHTEGLAMQQYIALLRDTKVFVSPFGIGEFSGKDYEAILSGALLVKPHAERLKAYPNIYDQKYAVAVSANFSDLGEKVMPFLTSKAELGKAQVMVDGARGMLKEYSSREHFAQDVDALLLRLLRLEAAEPSKDVAGYAPTLAVVMDNDMEM